MKRRLLYHVHAVLYDVVMTIKKFTPIKDVALTEQAATHIHTLLSQKEDEQKFRVYITGGGCSGFEYGFMFDDCQEDDFVVRTQGADVLVDALSMQYLRGATIDFKRDLSGAKFTVANPNATTTCSCGASFSA